MENYEKIQTIGKGSFGKVTKIRRKADGRELVWKELNYGSMNDKEKSQIVAEVNILRELRHPCIVRYYDRIIEKKSTKLYIVMEHCSGGDLASLLRRHRKDKTWVEEQFIWKVLGQVVSALKECHRHKENGISKPILHRDLKPANILLDKNMNAKLCDFGLATELAGSHKLAQTIGVGTPYYMSPELVNNQRYDERSDIWSVGCIIYEMASLSPPFDAQNQLALAVKINSGKIAKLPAQYSEELHRSCHWMLRREIGRRPRVEDLERLPNLVTPLKDTRLAVKEIELANQQSKLYRDRQAAEEKLAKWEAEIKKREEKLRKAEEALCRREQEVKRREVAFENAAASSTVPPPPPPLAQHEDATTGNRGIKRNSNSFNIMSVPAEVNRDKMGGGGGRRTRQSLGNVQNSTTTNTTTTSTTTTKEGFDSYKRRKTAMEKGGENIRG
ncbi:hypothetical protein TrLO_g11567 [Triparma laevis f. longispina]|uniref:non-specific serine/threonine protein kinase n=2 Tax=Triparma laevis TaxID=1534972 RepID=A0A9W7CJV4_9STRA|nr:hypothetical protein TrLO_g11567 [Triparma laevis f. longispina]